MGSGQNVASALDLFHMNELSRNGAPASVGENVEKVIRVEHEALRVVRRSGWEGVLPHRGMFPRRQALPHQACSRCLTDPLAAPQLLFLISKKLMLTDVGPVEL